LVPEVADLLARDSPNTLLVAAGGIADGRSLAASLMLGADGVLMGSRFWASEEANTHPNFQRAALARDGDGTVRGITVDIAWGDNFPPEFTGRVLRNALVERWYGREDEHRKQAEALRPDFLAALAAGNADEAGINIGEAIGLMDRVEPAAKIVSDVVNEAEKLLRDRPRRLLL
jgi:nitronate monooxygenase